MTLDAIIRLALLLSIWLLVLSLGARATIQSATWVLRRPAELARVLVAMFVIVPAFAVFLAATTAVPAPIKFAIVAMSVGPAPPILPQKQIKAGAGTDYSLGLLVAASLASIVLTPLLVEAASRLLHAQASISAGVMARTVLLSIGLPLGAGMILRAVWARGAEPLARFAQVTGGAVTLAVFVLMIGAARHEIFSLVGDGAMLAIAATVAIGLLAGHVLAGPRHRLALALAAASRHPGVALAIAELSYPRQHKEIVAAILMFLLLTSLMTLPYIRWMRGRDSALGVAPARQA